MTRASHRHDSKKGLLDRSTQNMRKSRIVAAGQQQLFLLFLACVFLLSCTTTTELKINRPKEVVDQAVINVQDKLQRKVEYFSSVEQAEYTDLKITMGPVLKGYLHRVLLQEFYLLDGYSLPPNPPFFEEKKFGTLVWWSLLNSVFAYDYIFRDFAGYPEVTNAESLFLGVTYGVLELLFLGTIAAPSIVSSNSAVDPIDKERATFGVFFGTGMFAYTKLFAIVQGAVYNRRHNIGLESGYNFDKDYYVAQFFDIPIEWRPGVPSGMDRDAVQRTVHETRMKDRPLAVVAIAATDDGESAALQDFVANDLIGLGFTKVVDRLTVARAIEASPDDRIRDGPAGWEVGRLVGADHVIIGAMTTLGETFYLNLKLISVETEAIIASSVASAKTRDDFLKMSNQAVADLVGTR
jgi:hypothetical protein